MKILDHMSRKFYAVYQQDIDKLRKKFINKFGKY